MSALYNAKLFSLRKHSYIVKKLFAGNLFLNTDSNTQSYIRTRCYALSAATEQNRTKICSRISHTSSALFEKLKCGSFTDLMSISIRRGLEE